MRRRRGNHNETHDTYLPTCLLTYSPKTYLVAYLPTYLPIYLPTYLPTCLPTYLPTYIPTCLHTCLPTYAPAYLLAYAMPRKLGKNGEENLRRLAQSCGPATLVT